MSSSGPRTSIELRLGFRFRLGEAPRGAEELVYDDSDWELVELPHTWNALDATARNMHRGIGNYRLRFWGPPLGTTQRAYLIFDGVGTVSSVLNRSSTVEGTPS